MRRYFGYFICLLVAFLWFTGIPFFEGLNNIVVDKLHGDIEVSPEIVIVGIDDKSFGKLGGWPWDRHIFAKLLEKISTSSPRVIAFDVLFFESREGDEKLIDVLKKTSFPVVMASKFDPEIGFLGSVFSKWVFGDALVNLPQDGDGKIRRLKTGFDVAGGCDPAFSMIVYQKYLGKDWEVCSDNNYLIFNYSNKKFIYVSLIDVLEGNSEIDFGGKIVLIGSAITDLKNEVDDGLIDIFGKKVPGVYIHANILNSFLQNKFQRDVDKLMIYTFTGACSLFLFWLFIKIKNNRIGFGIFIVIFLIMNFGGVVVFEFGINWWFVQTTLVLIFTYIASIFLKYIFEGKENRFVKKAFERYINPKLLVELLRNPGGLKLGGQKREMTVMFSDIRSFTSLSEGMSPEELIKMINEYLNEMSEVILENDGTIDKFIGDAIMAFWGAPLSDNHHREKAIKTALEMEEGLDRFRKKYPNYPKFDIGIGINTGEMVVGNIGGRDRFDYTVLGDNVNLASRLEGLTKKYKTRVLVSDSVVKDLRVEGVIFRLVDEVVVKGRQVAVKIYQPMKNNIKNKKIKVDYEKAFKLYQEGEFEEARVKLVKIKSDTVSEMMIERMLTINKKDESWGGVWWWDEK